METNATFSVVISTRNRWRAPKLATDRSLKFPCCRLVIMTMRVCIRNIAGGDSIMQYCKVYYIWRPRLPVRPCDERPPAMYGHFCLVPRVSVHDRYYCICNIVRLIYVSLSLYALDQLPHSFNHPHSHSLTQSLTHSLTQTLTHSPNLPPTNSVTQVATVTVSLGPSIHWAYSTGQVPSHTILPIGRF